MDVKQGKKTTGDAGRVLPDGMRVVFKQVFNTAGQHVG